MTIKASNTNKLLCDNNTVKTHHVNWSDFLRKLGFLDKIASKNPFFLFPTKVYKDLKAIKARKTSPLTEKTLEANKLLCDNNTVKTHHVNWPD